LSLDQSYSGFDEESVENSLPIAQSHSDTQALADPVTNASLEDSYASGGFDKDEVTTPTGPALAGSYGSDAFDSSLDIPAQTQIQPQATAGPSGLGDSYGSAAFDGEDDTTEDSKKATVGLAEALLEDNLLEDTPPNMFMQPAVDPDSSVSVLTWNVAAVNNNPFEYWVTFEDPVYMQLMQGVESFLQDPGEHDVRVDEIFTEAMFQEVRELMAKEGLEYLDEVESMWRDGALQLGQRKIVSEFIKDKALGAKRLMSMPDRITNTINVVAAEEGVVDRSLAPVCRPCVINNYDGDLSTMDGWWEKWKAFMFEVPLTVRAKKGVTTLRPIQMLEPIQHSKYPAVTEEEERITIPLQVVCQAIFDAILLHIMHVLSPDGQWQRVKSTICDALYREKHTRTLEILVAKYSAVDVMCLQEVAAAFQDLFHDSPIAQSHKLLLPAKMDGKRGQNSVLILRREKFPDADAATEVTSQIEAFLEGEERFADGDLTAFELACGAGQKHLFVSFHGDTNGHLTLPLVRAVDSLVKSEAFQQHHAVLGLDANVYARGEQKGKQSLEGFVAEWSARGLTSCWGDDVDPDVACTTCTSRTSLQPQLNKAIRFVDRIEKGDMNPKDVILFYKGQLQAVSKEDMGHGRQKNPVKDNTGRLLYMENVVFPTLEFPSDHGILAMALRPVRSELSPVRSENSLATTGSSQWMSHRISTDVL